jgi:hypothetical protein
VRAPPERSSSLDIGQRAEPSMRTNRLIVFDESGQRLPVRRDNPTLVRGEA